MFRTTLQGRDAGPFVYRFQSVKHYYANLAGQSVFFLFIPFALLGYPKIAMALLICGLAIHFGAVALDIGWQGVRVWFAGWAMMFGFILVLVGLPIAIVSAASAGVTIPLWHFLACGVGLLLFAHLVWPKDLRPWWPSKKKDDEPVANTAFDRFQRFVWLKQELSETEMKAFKTLPLPEQLHLIEQPLDKIRLSLTDLL